jgi:predicted RNase H-like HicB family nuclease
MRVSIEKQNDGTYIAYNTGSDKFTALGSGATITEAREDFFNSIEEIKETYQEHGEEVPAELLEAPEFKFDLASFFEYYSFINVTAFAKTIGINGSLMRQYKKGGTYISDAQLTKIQTFVNNMGADFQRLHLV